MCLGVFVVASLMVANLRRSGSGRRLIAVRNNERAAASLGISVFGAKLYAFASVRPSRRSPGSCSRSRTPPSSTAGSGPFQSINTVGNAVAGGIGWVLGAVFGGHAGGGRSRHDLRSTGSISGPWLITIGGVTLILIVMLNPNGIASVVLNDERGIGRLRAAAAPQAAPRAARRRPGRAR